MCPILKDASTDPRIPMNYRGVSLLSCISKIYSAFINQRITSHLDEHEVLADEQNGFRKNRSCEDHVFTLNSVIRNSKSLFVAFIDLRKCFDFIDREMMLYKLLVHDIDGKVYNSVKSIYQNSESCVRLNGQLTNWFSCNTGVKQGDNLSPTLFSIFINDLVQDINELGLGVDLGGKKLSLLLYADDIAMIAKSEAELQRMLDKLHQWCKRWRVLINTNKSKCVHFRKGKIKRSNCNFTIGSNALETVDHYKYLGVTFHYNSCFNSNAELLAKSGGRALGQIIAKIHNNKYFGFTSYEKLFSSCVAPILDYGAGVWGYRKFQAIDNIQNRAIRYFLGVHRFTPIVFLYGDVGWLPSQFRRWLCMLRYWNKLICFEDDRITKKAFNLDYERCRDNWCSEVKHIMNQIGIGQYYDTKCAIDLGLVESHLTNFYSEIWKDSLENVPKLRTYKTFKNDFGLENYVSFNLSKAERSHMAQLRSGILPLRIETGRYVGEPPNERLCTLCTQQETENELHFVLGCPFYNQYRTEILGEQLLSPALLNRDRQYVFTYLMSHKFRQLSKFVVKAFRIRRQSLYI